MKTLKINFLLCCFLFLFSSILQAQVKDSTNKNPSSSTIEEEVFVVVEDAPEFPGGDEARLKFFQKNIVYPKAAKEKGIQGKVIISFIVEKDGSITNIKVIRSVNPDLDAESLRVVNLMPKWIPGKQRGFSVRCLYTIPVVFVLQ